MACVPPDTHFADVLLLARWQKKIQNLKFQKLFHEINWKTAVQVLFLRVLLLQLLMTVTLLFKAQASGLLSAFIQGIFN